MDGSPPVSHAVLADGVLALSVDSTCRPLLGSWLPFGAAAAAASGPVGASIAIASTPDAGRPRVPSVPSTLRIGDVRAWVQDDTALLIGGTGAIGRIDQTRRHADVRVPSRRGEAAADLQPMLTIAAALLLGRLGRILLHAGAVVADDGRAWLVVGDARSGKSTTCVSLASSGWQLLSDDQVVLHASGEGGLMAEGWLRPLHLDEGWSTGKPTGSRTTIPPPALGLRITTGLVEIAGTLHTSVTAARPSAVSIMTAGESFIGLVRQSPWLLADRAAAPAIVERLSALARLPRRAVSLGRDTFGRPRALRTVIERAPDVRGSG